MLRRAVAGDAEARAHAGSARYAIEYNEVAWSDAAFDALAAAATLPDMDDAARLAAELRAKHERSW